MKEGYFETPLRSVVKAISWRASATLTTIALVFIFTKKITIALSIGGLEMILKLLIYYLHERFWNRIKWGHIKNKGE